MRLPDLSRSNTVIPQELIREINATTFAVALKTVPGITSLGGDAAANPSADSAGNNIRSNTPCNVPFNCTPINA